MSCAHATAIPGSRVDLTTSTAKRPKKGKKSATPNAWKHRFANATRRAVRCILIWATSAVAVVPRFCPDYDWDCRRCDKKVLLHEQNAQPSCDAAGLHDCRDQRSRDYSMRGLVDRLNTSAITGF